MNRMIALLRREFWENKGAFRTTPIVIGGIYIVFLLMSIFTTAHFDSELYTFREAVRVLANQSAEFRGMVMYQGMLGSSVFFTAVMGFVIFFYLLGSLYDDRKDRSILFWKSLPVSDTLTLASKLITAMVVIPTFFVLILVITHIIMAIIGSAMILSVDGNPWTLFLGVTNPLKAWAMIAASWFAHSIWALPMYGWLMLVSAFAPRVPLLFATLPLLVFAVLQTWIEFLRTFTLKSNIVGVVGEWMVNSPAILTAQVIAESQLGDEGRVMLRINPQNAGPSPRIRYAEDAPVTEDSTLLKDQSFRVRTEAERVRQ
ncbi:MAG: hypothetical protein IIA64_07965 [Planctomycetes bacterium]|nr:hypothetical protein [Planctomycetota bacterium]